MDNSFKSVIGSSKSILILLPTKPYFDQVAAGLALFLTLREEKDTQVYSPTPMTVELNRLIGVNKIAQELGNKNLIIRFSDYKANDIERVSYDIEEGQFRLTVIPKQRISPPSKEQVELSYSGISADTVIMIGGANESHFPALSAKELTSANVVHIGTRDLTMSSNKNYVSFSKPAAAVSEVVADLIKESGMKIDEDIATNLLMGIEEASDNFTSNSVTADTFATISALMKAGGKRISGQMPARREDFPSGSIPGDTPRPQEEQQTKVQENTTVDRSGQDQKKEDENPQNDQSAPKDWLKPKIFKGTSIS